MEHIDKYKYEEVPPIAVYHQIYLTNADAENVEHYYRLMKLLDRFGDLFPKDEAEFIYGFALNYCIKKLNQGSRQFLEEYFNVFEILLDRELLIKDGELSPWHFRNIVVIALRLGKTEWSKSFIEKYKEYLPSNMRINAVKFNLAQVYFYQKQFEKVIELLSTVEYEDLSYDLNSKVMLLVTYYEIDEVDALHSFLESFRTYLNRHKDIPLQRRTPYNNLIKIVKKIDRLIAGDNNAINKIKEDINKIGDGNIANITWLKEKIAELE
ncbi:MAG: hypothetical protein AAFZ15_27735 [Bacteroidota bacterium]